MSQYDLKVLLDLRGRAKEDAEQEYGAQLNELERRKRVTIECCEALEAAIVRRKQLCEAFDVEIVEKSVAMADVHRFDAYIEGLKLDEKDMQRAIKRAELAESVQEREVEEARIGLLEASRQLKAVEKHHEQWLAEQKVLMDRKQSDALDDIAARIWREQHS